jgi:hypothetical protein
MIEKICSGDISECCGADVDLATDGDADWLVCLECGEVCNTVPLILNTAI